MEIIKRAKSYIGFDVSEGLLELARKRLPIIDFELGDVANFEFPKGIEIVFSFASLLHSSKDEVHNVLQKIHAALSPGGICYISLKYAPEYTEKLKEDRFGRRLFYLYNPEIIESLAGKGYKVAATIRETIGYTEWFEIALQKT